MSELMKRRGRGLPVRVKMRHEAHFVEELAARHEVAVGKMVPLSAIEANPDQPRKDIGDLDDLVASIRAKGVLEPLLVRRDERAAANGRIYRIIAGERRYRAALAGGLFEVPVIELEVTEEEALEIALIENLQRRDLNAFEEAEGFRGLMELHGYTHQQVADAVGRSRTSVTETLKLLNIPPEIRSTAALRGLSRSMLLELARAGSPDEVRQMLETVLARGANRDDVRALRHSEKPRRDELARRKPYVFRFKSPDRSYSLALQFRQATVDREDLIRALERILSDLRTSQHND